MKKKYFITSNDEGHFFFNGEDVTNEWYSHFSGLTYEQENRCTRLFIPYILRRRPHLKSKSGGTK
jgi:hypothetical protein